MSHSGPPSSWVMRGDCSGGLRRQDREMKHREYPHGEAGARARRISPFLVLFLLWGCADDSSQPVGSLRFGQIGEVRISLEVPLTFNGGRGQLQQAINWNSSGAWQLVESISYRGIPGDQNHRLTQGAPGEYAYFIAQLHEAPGLKLFEADTGDPAMGCPVGKTRVTITVRDETRNESQMWVRCSEGNLATLQTSSAGPDEAAVRVIQAVILVRDFTEGRNFLSYFSGSVPFATLDRSEDSGITYSESRAFYSDGEGNPRPPSGWIEFWREHLGDPKAFPPPVDWSREVVLVAVAGKREEAGDSVEVRRVLQTGLGTQVDLVERIPGDFCSPAAREHYPIHIVVTPRTLFPIEFSGLTPERFTCGF